MKRKNVYKIIVDDGDQMATLEIDGGYFTARKIFIEICKQYTDFFEIDLVKNDTVIKTCYFS